MTRIQQKLMLTIAVLIGCLGSAWLGQTQADPCGMVPPAFIGDQSPIARIGLQKTYVFHKDGVESFVIRPGFTGKVDNFGMLIPFPNPPEIRKVADDIFEHVANAIDPPEVVVDLRIRELMMQRGAGAALPAAAGGGLQFKSAVKVLKEEAVGMYEVAVLEAGSAAALQKWMNENGYQYPQGMDAVTEDYVKIGWCFVAVKTKVADKGAVEPRPGIRELKPELPDGSVFDGNVQGMGFRFKSEELVVPMRLSAFNGGDLRNVVYLLTEGPRKIRAIPEEYVMRQISGKQLIANVTQPLPLRIIGGTEEDIPEYQRNTLPARRDPTPKNGIAKELFASDLLAVASGELTLRHEEEEKELLRIGEYLGLRGADIDRENSEALAAEKQKTVDQSLALLENMTLSVIDGDFPRQVIARDNLKFSEYRMPQTRNDILNYDATRFGPGLKKEGVLKLGAIDWSRVAPYSAERAERRLSLISGQTSSDGQTAALGSFSSNNPRGVLGVLLAAAFLLTMAYWGLSSFNGYRRKHPIRRRTSRTVVGSALLIGLLWSTNLLAANAAAIFQNELPLAKLESSKTAQPAIDELVRLAKADDAERERIVRELVQVAKTSESLAQRGWSLAALTRIGGQDVDEYLLNIHADDNQQQLVRTWAAAARVSMTRTVNGLIEKANLIPQFPALGRPIGMRIIEKLGEDESSRDPEKILAVVQKVPQLQKSLAPMILSFGAPELASVMLTASDQQVRRSAAGYLGALAQQGQADEVAAVVNKLLQFDGQKNETPWEGGPLFLPGIQWTQPTARELVGSLLRWHLWCDIKKKSAEQRQIHNNIRSVGLARVAGYQSANWNNADTVQWLVAFRAAVGEAEIRRILVELGVENDPKYAAAVQ